MSRQVVERGDATDEREAVVAWLNSGCNLPNHDDRWCPACSYRQDMAEAIAKGEHRKVRR